LRQFTGKSEKYWLRYAFSTNHYCPDSGLDTILPENVLWRRKEAFSDGVSGTQRSLYQILQDYCAKMVPLNEHKSYEEMVKHNLDALPNNEIATHAFMIFKIIDKLYVFESHFDTNPKTGCNGVRITSLDEWEKRYLEKRTKRIQLFEENNLDIKPALELVGSPYGVGDVIKPTLYVLSPFLQKDTDYGGLICSEYVSHCLPQAGIRRMFGLTNHSLVHPWQIQHYYLTRSHKNVIH
jgi:hypothetical protein